MSAFQASQQLKARRRPTNGQALRLAHDPPASGLSRDGVDHGGEPERTQRLARVEEGHSGPLHPSETAAHKRCTLLIMQGKNRGWLKRFRDPGVRCRAHSLGSLAPARSRRPHAWPAVEMLDSAAELPLLPTAGFDGPKVHFGHALQEPSRRRFTKWRLTILIEPIPCELS